MQDIEYISIIVLLASALLVAAYLQMEANQRANRLLTQVKEARRDAQLLVGLNKSLIQRIKELEGNAGTVM